MQALFYMDIREMISEDALVAYCRNFLDLENMPPLFMELIGGIMEEKGRIDGIVERFSDNWKIDRMSCVDRNALRIAVYEMLFCPSIPEKVSINEAINIGKKFGTEESGSFINGILDSIRVALENKTLEIPAENGGPPAGNEDQE